ncbi:MAG: nucleotidyltransferase family protein [Nanoarchaeota archaeon]|nr:nucleotidyltransferase family protein [Nanoarchaeota archaeon]
MKKANEKQKEIEVLKKKIISFLKKEGVKKAGIFGSYARGEQKKSSDIDILIEFDGSLLDLVRLERILKEKLKKNIDLLSYGGINHRLKDIILNEEIRII